MKAYGKTLRGPIVNYLPGQFINGDGKTLNFTTEDMLVCITGDSMIYGKAAISTGSKDEVIVGNFTVPYYDIYAVGIVEKVVAC